MPNAGPQKQLTDWTVPLQIRKFDTGGPADSVTFSAWASIITTADGTPIVDHDGEVIKVADLERAVHVAAMEAGGEGRGGVMHKYESKLDVLESWVDSHAKQDAFGEDRRPEGWKVTCRTTDPEAVKAIRSGEMRELSIRGNAEKDWVD